MPVPGWPGPAPWAAKFHNTAYALGLRMPGGYWSNIPVSTTPVSDAMDRAPSTMKQQPLPLLGTAESVPRGLTGIVVTAEGLGIVPGNSVSVPGGPSGVFTVSVYPDDIPDERVIHLDQHSGEVL